MAQALDMTMQGDAYPATHVLSRMEVWGRTCDGRWNANVENNKCAFLLELPNVSTAKKLHVHHTYLREGGLHIVRHNEALVSGMEMPNNDLIINPVAKITLKMLITQSSKLILLIFVAEA